MSRFITLNADDTELAESSAMRTTWAELFAAFQGAGLGAVSAEANQSGWICIEFAETAYPYFQVRQFMGSHEWLEVREIGRAWTSLDALKARLAERVVSLADERRWAAEDARRVA